MSFLEETVPCPSIDAVGDIAGNGSCSGHDLVSETQVRPVRHGIEQPGWTVKEKTLSFNFVLFNNVIFMNYIAFSAFVMTSCLLP